MTSGLAFIVQIVCGSACLLAAWLFWRSRREPWHDGFLTALEMFADAAENGMPVDVTVDGRRRILRVFVEEVSEAPKTIDDPPEQLSAE